MNGPTDDDVIAYIDDHQPIPVRSAAEEMTNDALDDPPVEDVEAVEYETEVRLKLAELTDRDELAVNSKWEYVVP